MQTARPNTFDTARIITGALVAGVVVFWAVAWVLTDGGATGLSPGVLSAPVAVTLWGAVAVPGFGGALFFRSRASGAGRGQRSARSKAHRTGTRDGVQTSLILAHALLEAPALLGGVLFLLLGAGSLTWVALPVYATGVLICWPRRDEFGGEEGTDG